MSERKATICPNCKGYAILLCPWCKSEERDLKGKVTREKIGAGCKACVGRGVFICPQCEGRGVLAQDEYEVISDPRACDIDHTG